jgi:hypothetical protein
MAKNEAANTPPVVPEDLSELALDELVALDEQLTALFNGMYDPDDPTADVDVAALTALSEDIQRVRGEHSERVEAARQAREQVAALAAQVNAEVEQPDEDEDDEEEGAGEPPAEPEDPEAEVVPADEVEVLDPEKVAVAAAGKLSAQPRRYPKLNASWADVRRRAPAAAAPNGGSAVVTASSDIPDVPMGSRLNLDQLVEAIHAKASSVAVTQLGANAPVHRVAEMRLDFPETLSVLGDLSDPAETEALMARVGDQGRLLSAMPAAGGWCAPSETRYSFFNVTCQDGGVDLPTFGVNRGGLRFPVSPTLADVFTGTFTSGTNPWLWTETDDIATVTGTPNKPCVRVPCPTFTDVRLECYGICLTAGNLADDAYPEATANQLRLLEAAHFHASNARYIAQMVGLSTPTGGPTAIGAAGSGTFAPLLGSVELAAIDYKTRFGMCEDDILETVLPAWAKGAIRSDLAKRSGVDLLSVSDAQIADHFDARRVRVQFVQDWQVRSAGLPGGATPITAWPTTVDFMIYAAGTFQRGNGMSLRIAMLRDSVLNAENDHTALFMEECHLIARFGHESRQYRVAICTDGTTGASDLTACGV